MAVKNVAGSKVWKDQRSRSSSLQKKPFKSYEERKREREELENVKALERELKEEVLKERKEKGERRRLRAEKKKEAEIKHAIRRQGAVYIKDTKKIKSWNKKARQQLVKMAPEYLAEFMKNSKA